MTFAVHHMVGLTPHHVIYSGKLQPISSLMVSLCLKNVINLASHLQMQSYLANTVHGT